MLNELVTKLALLRNSEAALSRTIEAAFEAVKAEQYGNTMQRDELRTEIEAVTAQIKAEAMRQFKEDGDRTFTEGVSIRRKTFVKYDPAKALEWCRTYKPEALKIALNTSAFEKAARDGRVPDEVVTVEEDYEITIASKLGAVLIQEESNAGN